MALQNCFDDRIHKLSSSWHSWMHGMLHQWLACALGMPQSLLTLRNMKVHFLGPKAIHYEAKPRSENPRHERNTH